MEWEERSLTPYYEVGGPESARSYETLKAEALRRGRLFEDPDFPANVRSLYRGSSPNVIWRRPGQIVSNPVFVNESATRFDLNQGSLGDCWFIAAAASIAATNRELLERVVPFDQSFTKDYAGIFRFRFWHYDKWIEVVVDDRLPMQPGRGLIYGYNRDDRSEFWSALLEKAYAKLKGSYQALDGGVIQEALVDMTNGISETISFTKEKVDEKETFELLIKMQRMNTLIGAPIYSKTRSASREVERTNGLFEGHAYSVTKLANIRFQDRDVHLLRMRNPWGRREWRGDWSDKSTKWNSLTAAQRRQLGVTIDNDGEFWISMEDVIANFDEINMTHLSPDAFSSEIAIDTEKKEWEVFTYRDSWVKGVSAGGCGNPPNQRLYWKNPQFKMTIDPEVHGKTVIISLTEVMTRHDSKVSIGFDVYQLRPGARELLDENYTRDALILRSNSKKYTPLREKTLRFELNPGKYVVIPATFYPHVESEFVMRVFAEMKTRTRPIDKPTGPLVSEEEEEDDLMSRLFKKYAQRGLVDASELRDIISEARRTEWRENEGFSLECSRSLLSTMDSRERRGMIGLDDVKKIWRNLNIWKNNFKAFDKNRNGTIDTYELGEVYNLIGLSVSRSVLTSIVRRYGGRQGQVEFEDLVLSSTRLMHMIRAFKAYNTNGSRDAVLNVDEWLQTTLYT